MFKLPKNKTTSLRFRRWSRAKYAVFCSLASVVSIGCVAISIADKSLKKAVGVCADLPYRTGFESSGETAEANEPEALLFQLKETTLSEISVDHAAACGHTSLYSVFI